MKQKTILFLLFFAFIATGISQHQGNQPLQAKKSGGGTHPKNVSLAITCPNGVFVQTNASCEAIVTTPTPTSTCNITFMSFSVGGGPVRVITPVGSIYPDSINLGVYGASTFDVVWFVIDDCNASATCTQTIFVQDLIVPDIGCPLDTTVLNSTALLPSGLTQVTIGLPKVADNCTQPASIVYTNDYTQGPDASGGYPTGVTTVCWTASDESSNTSTCCMTVTVIDDTKPSITCPDTLTVDCEAPVPFPYFLYFQRAGGSAFDESAIDTSTFVWVRDSLQDGQCPFEKTLWRHYAISDTTGNSDTCFQVIYIQDTLPPTPICQDITVYVDNRGMATADVLALNDNSFDACSDTLFIAANRVLEFTCENIPEAVSVSVTFTDECGNAAHCQALITVADTISPTIECPPDFSVMPDAGSCFATDIFLGAPDPSDNCVLSSIIPFLNGVEAVPQTQFPAGINQVIWEVTDQSGHTGTCVQFVTVADSERPVITCPDNIQVNSDDDLCSAIVQYPNPIAEDNCAIDTIELNTGFLSGEVFPVGTTEVMYIARDKNQNADSCSFFVTVMDDMKPEITCPPNITLSATTGECGRQVAYSLPVGTDNCPGAETRPLTGQANNTFFNVGQHTVVYVVTAANGMSSTCSFTVRINDNQLPSITCPSNIAVNSTPGQCGATVNHTPPVGTDNCPGAVTTLVTGQPSGSFYNAGITQHVYRVTDASGNSVACQFTITVTDNVAPQITCPSNITVSTQANQCNSTVNFVAPQGTDNCPGASTQQVSGLVSGSVFPVGTSALQFRVTAANGATANCTFSIVVEDTQAPVVNCPSNITVNAATGQCAAVVTYPTPVASDNCPNFTLARTQGAASGTSFNVGSFTIVYSVTAANQATATCSFSVTVVDNQPPVITCPSGEDISLSTTCTITVPDFRSLVTRSDNCGSTTISQLPATGAILSSGHNTQHPVTLTVTDQNGRTTTCTVQLTAKDQTGPQLTCAPTDTILISDTQSIPVGSLYTAISDNCGGGVTAQVRRSGAVCGASSQDIFGPAALFCCDDVSKNIVLTVRATDQRGNTATCNTTIRVEDNMAPVIQEDLPDITITCEFPVDVRNLDIFGTLADSEANRKPIIINNINYGRDGLFADNCGGTIVNYSVTNQLSSCRTGQLIRNFVVRDRGGNVDTISQKIRIVNQDPFTLADITWPAQKSEYNQCNDDDPDTAVTGAPVLRTSFCDQVAATYKDQTFVHPTYCKYVRRVWTVIDWCQYIPNTSNTPGKWTFTQHIYITNSVAPVIASALCRDSIICIQDNSCVAKVSLQAQGTDDCLPVNIRWSYTVDTNNDGGTPEITGTGDRITGEFQQGVYRVVWTARDGCSNQSQCASLITVRDCKKPVASAKQGLAVSLSAFAGTATIKASDFNNLSSDNCTASALLKFSFSKNTALTTRTMTCDSVGRRKVQFWVTDLAGNQSMVETFITVQDNHRYCGNPTGGRIVVSGHVFTEDKVMLSDAEIGISAVEVEDRSMTGTDGQYLFSNLPADRSYTIRPDKKTNPLLGISTLDLVMIQRHIVGLSPIQSPYSLLAADVNGSGTVSASDIVELRKLMLGIQSQFGGNDPWRFVDASYTLTQTDNINTCPVTKELDPSSEEPLQADFIVIKTGDVNGSISQRLADRTEQRSADAVEWSITDVQLMSGQKTEVPVYSLDTRRFAGFQGSFQTNGGTMITGLRSGRINIQEGYYHIQPQDEGSKVLFSFLDTETIDQSDEPLFYLQIYSDKETRLGQVLSPAVHLASEAVDITLQLHPLVLRLVSLPPFGISQNIPNPFADDTTIRLQLTSESEVTVDIYNPAGLRISHHKAQMQAGENSLLLTQHQLGDEKGILLCRITVGNETRVVKMIRIQ